MERVIKHQHGGFERQAVLDAVCGRLPGSTSSASIAPRCCYKCVVTENYLADRAGHKGIKAARSQYVAWLDIVARAQWRNPEDVKGSYPKASILKAGRVVFNIKGNDYRLIARVQYQAGILVIRFFGTHAEYDEIDAETV